MIGISFAGAAVACFVFHLVEISFPVTTLNLAYEVLDWPHTGKGSDGDEWLAFRCPTPGCESEGIARSREFGFGRCGRRGAIMEVVNRADAPRSRASGSVKISCVVRERIERFLKNLASALGYCIAEDVGVLDTAIPALICVGVLWFIGMAVYDFILDPHVISAATLDSLSINPDKWILR